MRNEFVNQLAGQNAMELDNLIKETKEMNAETATMDNMMPVFTAANLWNIHNKRRIRNVARTFVA